MIIKGKENKVLSIIKENIIINCIEKGYLPLVMMDGSPESFVNFAASILATTEVKYYLSRYSYIANYKNILILNKYIAKSINRSYVDINFPTKLDLLIEKEKLLDINVTKFDDYLLASMFSINSNYQIIGNKSEDLCRFNINKSLIDNFIYMNPLSFISHGEVLQILSTIAGYVDVFDFKEYRDLFFNELKHIGNNLFSTVSTTGQYLSIGLLERFNRAMDKNVNLPFTSETSQEKAENLLRSDLIDYTDVASLMDINESETEVLKKVLEIEKQNRHSFNYYMEIDKRALIKDCLQ